LGILKAKAELFTITKECLEAHVKLWTAQGVTGAGCGLPGHESSWCESCQIIDNGEASMPPALAPAPNITPASWNFRPSANPVTRFQSCRPLQKPSR
jgi:hypothetical protein